MATNPYGMLGLGAPEAMEQQRLAEEERRAMSYAQLTPSQQSSYNSSAAAQMVGRGVGSLVGQGIGAVTGQDVRDPAQKLRAVQQQIAQAMQGIDPSDIDKAYPVMIRVLQANGMTPEAMAMAQEYEKLKQTKATHTRLETKDANDVRLRQLKLDQYDPRSPLNKAIDQLQALIAKRDKLDPESVEYKNLTVAIDTLKNNLVKETKGSIKLNDIGHAVEILNGEDGSLIRLVPKGNDPNRKGGDLDPVTGKPKKDATDKTLRELPLAIRDISELARLSQAFHPSYALPPGLHRLAAKLATASGNGSRVQLLHNLFSSNQAAAAWWSAYAALMTEVRHKLFGATLTGGEDMAFQLIQALLVKNPDDTINKLKEQATKGLANVSSEVEGVGSVKELGVIPQQLAEVKPLVAQMRGSSVSSTYSYTPPTATPTPTPAAPSAPAGSTPPQGVTVRRIS